MFLVFINWVIFWIWHSAMVDNYKRFREFSTSFFRAEDWNMEALGSPGTLVETTQKTII
jgi:hypothetical protein